MSDEFDDFFLLDDSQIAWTDINTKWHEEAVLLALKLVREGSVVENDCIVTDTAAVRKVRFHGHQFTAYRFIYCALTKTVAAWADVVRHRCHNRRCINPQHLQIGSRADNKRDDWDYWANGIDPAYL